MFSQTVEYALRAVVCLARNAPKPLTTQQISEITKVPGSYLSKVLQSLAKAEVVSATRGIHGGYSLRVPPDQLNILQVVSAIDPLKRIKRCPLGLVGHDTLCPLHRRLDQAMADTERALSNSTVGELLRDPSGIEPLCAKGDCQHKPA